MIKVAVILPIYNEAECLETTVNLVLEFGKKNNWAYSFIFVNDGSTDESLQILTERIKNISSQVIHLISYYPRRGKGYAVKQGVTWTEADYICFMDSDLAYSLEHIEILVEKLDKFDMVIGCRHLDPYNLSSISWLRQAIGKIFNILSRSLLHLRFTDMQAGLKGFRRESAKELFKRQNITGFSFDVELIYLAKKRNYCVGEIPARVTKQHLHKETKVRLIRDSITMLINLLQILYNDKLGRYE